MNRLAIFAVLTLLFAVPAFAADGDLPVGGGGTSTTVNVVSGAPASSVRQAPPVVLGGLTAVPETCMGSTQVGGSSIFGGLAFGTTWSSESCELRMFARSLMALGLRDAAVALLAQNEKVSKALEDAGVPIPGRQKKTEAAASNKSATKDFNETMIPLPNTSH